MSDVVIKFENVAKIYESHAHKVAGLKNYLFNFHKIRKQYVVPQYKVLDGISFEIRRGEVVGFIGRNGAGKSTLLSLIAGVIRPNGGVISVSDRVSSLLELGAGFHMDLTGRENIELYGVVLGFSRNQVRARMDEIIAYSELGDHIEVPIRYYSSGMLARLGFSVIAHLDPQILLIDEVLAVGDYSFQRKCLETMEMFRTQGKTMIVVSHSAGDIEKLCDRAIWLESGKLACDGAPAEVIEKYHDTMS